MIRYWGSYIFKITFFFKKYSFNYKMNRITDNIKKITVRGYDERTKMYKFELKVDNELDGDDKIEKDIRVNIQWNRIQKGFKNIKKELNKNVYAKLMYDLELNVVVNDIKYNSLNKFINGVVGKKNVRKINDIQNLMNQLILNRDNNDQSNKMAVMAFLNKTFGIVN